MEENYDKILARTDCFRCGADAIYRKLNDEAYEVDCVNIDCPCSEIVRVRKEHIEASL